MPTEREIDSDNETPVTTFASLFAEGDTLSKQGEFQKAIDAFTRALNMKPNEKNCLIARSKCYLLLGSPNQALADAEEALKEDPSFYKGTFQKAEALYSKGDFEMALLFYHKGYQAKPEVDEFRLGIQKAKEAINNAIGNPKDFKIRLPRKKQSAKTGQKAASSRTRAKREEARHKQDKQLLGELYEDQQYLHDFLTKEVSETQTGIREIVETTLTFLHSRIEFWRQQKPIYARSHKQKALHADKAAKNSPKDLENKLVNASLRNIQRVYKNGDFIEALRFAQVLLHKLTPNGEHDISSASDPLTLAKTYEWLGHIHLKLNRKSSAVSFFKKQLEVCRKSKLSEEEKEALTNLTTLYLQFRRFQSAIGPLTSLLKLIDEKKVGEKGAEMKLQVLFDLTRCYLETQDPANAERIWKKHEPVLQGLEDKSHWSKEFDSLREIIKNYASLKESFQPEEPFSEAEAPLPKAAPEAIEQLPEAVAVN